MSTSAKRPVRIVGVDIATQPKNVGLGLGTLSGGELRVESVTARESWNAIDAEVGEWLRSSGGAVLLALDAPLGWPSELASALRGHRAGASVQPAANAMFRRRTDDVVAAALGKRPLDVGADRIARTAHAALEFLTRMRRVHGREVPLAWQPGEAEGVSAIEVYPAGTLASRGYPSTGYKGTAVVAVEARAAIIERLRSEMGIPDDAAAWMRSSDHLLDAALCCLGAADFMRQEVIAPEDLPRARQEGWIWVSPPR